MTDLPGVEVTPSSGDVFEDLNVAWPTPEEITARGGDVADFLSKLPISKLIAYYTTFVESSVHMRNSSLVPREGEDDNTAAGVKATWLAFAGLAGEVIEVFEVIDTSHSRTAFVDSLIEELGDVCWYFFLLAYNLGIPEIGYTTIRENGAMVTIFEGGNWMYDYSREVYRVLGQNEDWAKTPDEEYAGRMVIAAGKLLEISKKALIHGKASNLSDQFKFDVITPQMQVVFQNIVLLANHFSTSLHDVLVRNMVKLVKRRMKKTGAFADPQVSAVDMAGTGTAEAATPSALDTTRTSFGLNS